MTQEFLIKETLKVLKKMEKKGYQVDKLVDDLNKLKNESALQTR